MQHADQKERYRAPTAGNSDSTTEATDPVCGMRVAMATAKHRAEIDGRHYYFCSSGCRARFIASPGQYSTQIGEPDPSGTKAPQTHGMIYTCPMHPQVQRSEPGSCPICGMALEAQGIPNADGTSPELRDMGRRLLIGAFLAAPIFVLEMGGISAY